MNKIEKKNFALKRLSKVIVCGLIASPLLLSAPTLAGGKERLEQQTALALTDDIRVAGSMATPDTTPTLMVAATPKYPFEAIVGNTEGWVVVELGINAAGVPENAKVLASDAGKTFHKTSLRALKKLRFTPATYGGKPVRVTGKRYKITYALSSS